MHPTPRSSIRVAVLEKRLSIALRAAPMVALELDAGLRVTWGRAFGAVDQPEPSRMLDLFAAGQASRFLAIARRVLERRDGERAELELALEGQPRTYDVLIEPAGDGVVAVGFDITPCKLAEARLREADRRKDEFLAMLSHELRNPLTPLKVALDIARMSEDNSEQWAQSCAIMERQLAQLSKLVDELLDLSRITQGKIELGRVALDPVVIVEEALETTRPLFHDRRHRIDIHLPATPVRLLGDRGRLVQVLTNLLTNAAKYTPDGGQIDLDLEPDPARGVIVLRVRDNGIGISEELLPRIFELFVQGREGPARSRSGLGIGLHLVRRIVELHGGTVRASSAGENRGSELVVELPTAAR